MYQYPGTGTSDCTVLLPLYWDRISNSTSVFQPEPNHTQDIRIAFCLLFSNLKLKLTNKIHTLNTEKNVF